MKKPYFPTDYELVLMCCMSKITPPMMCRSARKTALFPSLRHSADGWPPQLPGGVFAGQKPRPPGGGGSCGTACRAGTASFQTTLQTEGRAWTRDTRRSRGPRSRGASSPRSRARGRRCRRGRSSRRPARQPIRRQRVSYSARPVQAGSPRRSAQYRRNRPFPSPFEVVAAVVAIRQCRLSDSHTVEIDEPGLVVSAAAKIIGKGPVGGEVGDGGRRHSED